MYRSLIYDKIKIGNTYINPGQIDFFQIDEKLKTIVIHLYSGSEFLFNIDDCRELLEAFSIKTNWRGDIL